jgi:hypothetical protein
MFRINTSTGSLIAITLATAASGLGCAGKAEPPSPAPLAAAEQATTPPAAGEPVFEPAYPAEVSTEGLSETDVAQQHSHDGAEPHAHGEEEGHDGSEGDHGHPH